ncbi:hypothetical protein M8J77_004613 [Diaphorina citri]|nr:hypothetical protein M8J77_004613 [Diaphorina citri]
MKECIGQNRRTTHTFKAQFGRLLTSAITIRPRRRLVWQTSGYFMLDLEVLGLIWTPKSALSLATTEFCSPLEIRPSGDLMETWPRGIFDLHYST